MTLNPEQPTVSERNDCDSPPELDFELVNRQVFRTEAKRQRRRFRRSVLLFLLTFVSTTLVGADFWPLIIAVKNLAPDTRQQVLFELELIDPSPAGETSTIRSRFWAAVAEGCTYSCPLMLILFCHEMGHYLQAFRYGVPASPPFFIPLPLPPLGTMGAVIVQGTRHAPDRKVLFDIAVSGPIAGLIATMPILIYGIHQSEFSFPNPLAAAPFEFGRPLLVEWLIDFLHPDRVVGTTFQWHGYAKAGWVGVFLTAMNLLPVGQLDGGHLMYALIGKAAHWVAWALILIGAIAMVWTGLYGYVLLLVLLTLTGPRHPKTNNDGLALNSTRILIGWLTLAFLVVGFTPQPILIEPPEIRPAPILQPLTEPLEESFLR